MDEKGLLSVRYVYGMATLTLRARLTWDSKPPWRVGDLSILIQRSPGSEELGERSLENACTRLVVGQLAQWQPRPLRFCRCQMSYQQRKHDAKALPLEHTESERTVYRCGGLRRAIGLPCAIVAPTQPNYDCRNATDV